MYRFLSAQVLDLRNNSLSSLRVDTARVLLADERRRLLLAHNALDCSCSTALERAVLRERQDRLDYLACTCGDGSPLQAAGEEGCGPGAAAAGAALTVLLAAAVLVVLACRPAVRLRLKAALHERGWLPRAKHDKDDSSCRFDVFVSFSHGDERFVRDELVSHLESGPAPYRVCVHYRDWAPGGWIPAQIAASVRASRRTVAVVSTHFLRSSWARAEFQEAHALALREARPRLVVVLLDEPTALPLDDKLRTYLATNTYVRWGDPWFWQKLRLALPRGRGLADEPAGPGPEVGGPEAEMTAPPQVCSEPSASSSPSRLDSESDSSSSSSPASAAELARLVLPGACRPACSLTTAAFSAPA